VALKPMARFGMEVYSEDELRGMLAREISKRPWPTVGTVVSIAHDWDGPSTYNSDEFLTLRQNDRVRVAEVSPLGAWLRGTVVGSSRSGWFGGPGCEASMSVNLDIPLGSEIDEELPFIKPPLDPIDDPLRETEHRPWRGDMPDVPISEEDGDLGDLERDLEDYVARNQVDGSAAAALKALSPEMQAELIKSDMFNCRSPSAVLLSRIEKLKATWAHTGAPGRPVAPTVAPRRPIAVSRVQPTVAPVSVTMRGSAARSRSPRGRDGVPHPAMPPRKEQTWNDMSGEVEDFIERNQLDERVSSELRALSPEDQHMIVNNDLTNVRKPSAVVLSRIQRLRDMDFVNSVEEYLTRNNIDEVAGGALKMLPAEVQQQIIEKDLSGNPRNPSAVLLSRIRAVEASLGVPMGQPPPPAGAGWEGWHDGRRNVLAQVEDFIRQYGLDDKVSKELRSLQEEDMLEVMSCNITNARNPSAMVRSRIQAVRGSANKPKFSQAVEEYLARYEVDETAAASLRTAAPEVQERVVAEEMVNCRNPSAVLISRIRAATHGHR